ncbi:Large ribosomal subunit protein uL2my, C-terminal part [Salvia divinorum]|uniref:Large ribosomal subunit protein uL2my, C-terminal part n=1 Tax=Salvia divinorum TaxID=28513 RepID=A0ABD1FU96_SALDI
MALFRARAVSSSLLRSCLRAPSRPLSTGAAEMVESKEVQVPSLKSMMNQMLTLDISSQYGSCMPLSNMRIGMNIHNIELRPGQGGKLVRAAGTSAKILTEPNRSVRYCEIRLPSGEKRLIDKRCRATIGAVSNPEHGTKKLRKAGQSRWLGIRPTVRGVAMNPVDHPHGGGEGKSKSSGKHGQVSRTPWGKPTKSGYKTARTKKRKI